MSAFLVSKSHIDALLTIAHHWLIVDHPITELDAIGQSLLDENQRSVNYLYGDKVPAPRYGFKRRRKLPTPIEVIKAIACLEYQSSEHKGWEKSEARKFLNRLRNEAIIRLPGYEEAPWEIGEEHG